MILANLPDGRGVSRSAVMVLRDLCQFILFSVTSVARGIPRGNRISIEVYYIGYLKLYKSFIVYKSFGLPRAPTKTYIKHHNIMK